VFAVQLVEQQEEQPVVEAAQPAVQQEGRQEYVGLLDGQQEEQLVYAVLLVEVLDAQHEQGLVQLVGVEEVQDVRLVDAQEDLQEADLVIIEGVAEEEPHKTTTHKNGIGITEICGN
jgi:hypothetical protein